MRKEDEFLEKMFSEFSKWEKTHFDVAQFMLYLKSQNADNYEGFFYLYDFFETLLQDFGNEEYQIGRIIAWGAHVQIRKISLDNIVPENYCYQLYMYDFLFHNKDFVSEGNFKEQVLDCYWPNSEYQDCELISKKQMLEEMKIYYDTSYDEYMDMKKRKNAPKLVSKLAKNYVEVNKKIEKLKKLDSSTKILRVNKPTQESLLPMEFTEYHIICNNADTIVTIYDFY